MKKYFVFSDVHGAFDELMNALTENGFDINNKDQCIISCGDLHDRCGKSRECLNFAIDMYKQNRAILVRGNHEDLMEEAICRREFWSHDYHNYTVNTACEFTGLSTRDHSDFEILSAMKENELWNQYINSTVDYAKVGNNIFVHGWIPVSKEYDKYYNNIYIYNPDWRNASNEDWKASRWLNGMKLWNQGLIEPNRTIYCGHIHSSYGWANIRGKGKEYLNRVETMYYDDEGKLCPYVIYDPFIDNGIVNLDSCTVMSHKVNIAVIEE